MAGPEAANNASATGVLVPLLTLGLPTSATAAILLAASSTTACSRGRCSSRRRRPRVGADRQPLHRQRDAARAQPAAGRALGEAAGDPAPLLYAGILVFATLGTYGLHQSVVDLVMLYVFGLLGFLMRRFDFPVAPAVIGLILGPLAEQQFRRALAISQGDPSVFLTHPISAALLALTAIILFAPVIARSVKRRRAG